MPKEIKKEEHTSLSHEIQSLSLEMQHDALFSILTLGRVIEYLMHQKLGKNSDISLAKIEILETLTLNNGCLTSTAISKKVLKTKYTISRIIQQLEREGFVLMDQRPVKEDKRFKNVYITQKGIDFVRSQIPQRVQFAKDIISLLNSEEMSTLNSISKKFIDRLLLRMEDKKYIQI